MAASGSAVTVLTPNGRRQTIKVSPNMPLLQVLEDVSKKHGFNPEDHGLKFQRTVLDLTMPWRFANLPNNAKLEMVPSTRKQTVTDSQVRIALQMEDGSRLQDSFSSGQSLWELLTHFPQISASDMSQSTPVCVYMRDEVCGEEALKNTSLKSLGLTGGSAIVRFLLKNNKIQDEEYCREAAAPTASVAKEHTPSPSPQTDIVPSHPEISTTEISTSNSGPDRPEETPYVPSPVDAINTLSVRPEEPPNVQDAVRPKEPPPAEIPSTSSACSSISSVPAAPFIPFSGGGQRLGGPGGGVRPSTSSSLSALTAAVESPKAKKAKSSHNSTQKSQSISHHPNEDMDQGEEYLEPVEREPLIYHLDSMSHHTDDHSDLPDEFFEVTMDDVRKRFAQLKSERKLLEESPLMTKALRESQMKEKMDRYPKVVLRVQFPDRHVLQGFFRPLETVAAVRQFVRSHLEDPQLSFYLFITPPKTILSDPSATLFQANLFPGALVYLGSDAITGCCLKKELLQSSVSALQANESIASCMFPSPTPSSSSLVSEEQQLLPEMKPDTSGASQEDSSAHSQAAKPTRSDPGKVPKWLKLPGKK